MAPGQEAVPVPLLSAEGPYTPCVPRTPPRAVPSAEAPEDAREWTSGSPGQQVKGKDPVLTSSWDPVQHSDTKALR